MAENPSNRDPLETDETLSFTGGLPPDFFNVPESPASDRDAQWRPARDAPLPPRLAETPSSPRVVIERRASLPVVLVVIAGNIAFFLGGGLAGWAAARKGAARTEPPAAATTDSPPSEVVCAIDAKASKSAVDALSSRVGEVQAELGTLGRELARLEDRLSARTNAPPVARPRRPAARPRAAADEDRRARQGEPKALAATGDIPVAPPARRCAGQGPERPPHRGRLRTEAARRIVECLEGCDGVAPAAAQVSPADLGRDLGAALFLQGNTRRVRRGFSHCRPELPE